MPLLMMVMDYHDQNQTPINFVTGPLGSPKRAKYQMPNSFRDMLLKSGALSPGDDFSYGQDKDIQIWQGSDANSQVSHFIASGIKPFQKELQDLTTEDWRSSVHNKMLY